MLLTILQQTACLNFFCKWQPSTNTYLYIDIETEHVWDPTRVIRNKRKRNKVSPNFNFCEKFDSDWSKLHTLFGLALLVQAHSACTYIPLDTCMIMVLNFMDNLTGRLRRRRSNLESGSSWKKKSRFPLKCCFRYFCKDLNDEDSWGNTFGGRRIHFMLYLKPILSNEPTQYPTE